MIYFLTLLNAVVTYCTWVDGEVEEAEVTIVVSGGGAYTQQDRFTGRGSTGLFSEEGMEGRERERVRGLCARIVSGVGTDTGTTMGAREAGTQLPFIPSRLPSESWLTLYCSGRYIHKTHTHTHTHTHPAWRG